MAELLIRARDNKTGIETKGDIIENRANNAPYGTKEGLPDFIVVKIPTVLLATADAYWKAWNIDLDYTVQNYDSVNNIYTVRVFSTSGGVSGNGNLTKVMIENVLAEWNTTVTNFGTNEVIFDFSVFNGGTSKRFWGYPVDQMTFQNISYDNATGLHRIECDYNVANYNSTSIERAIMNQGATIISHENKIITFDIEKNIILTSFKKHITDIANRRGMVRKRRFYLSNAAVNNVIAQGGVTTATWAQFLGYVKDHLDD